MHIVACQFDIAWKDRQANFARVRSLLSQRTTPPGSLIILPEMFASGFTMNVGVALDAAGDTIVFLGELARAYQSTVVAGIVDKHADGRGLNQAVVIGPDGQEVTRYTKMHPFTPAGESDHYAAGDTVVTFEHGDFTVAPLICYDLRFPERFRDAVRLGAEVMLVIASWPAARAAHWTALLTARAVENQAYVVGVNRIGSDPAHTYPGLSTVIGPQGDVLALADDTPTALHADIDREALLAYRRALPFLQDMRD
jgi:predicted amidohydrolase